MHRGAVHLPAACAASAAPAAAAGLAGGGSGGGRVWLWSVALTAAGERVSRRKAEQEEL